MRVAGAAALVLASLILLLMVATVFVVFLGLYRTVQYMGRFNAVRAPRRKLSDIYHLLKTGDLVFFVASTHSPVNSAVTQTFFSHVGVLLREGELVYVSESTGRGELMPDFASSSDLLLNHGANLTPLLTRLKYYAGDCYVASLARALSSGQDSRLKELAERAALEEVPYPSLWHAILALLGRGPHSRHCFQHVAYLLDRVGVTRGLSGEGFVGVCDAVCGLPGGPEYGPIVQVLYDLDCSDRSDRSNRSDSSSGQNSAEIDSSVV